MLWWTRKISKKMHKNKGKLIKKKSSIKDVNKQSNYKNLRILVIKMYFFWYIKYYQMLMNGQQTHIENYVSPYSKRDNMKQ